MSSKAAGVGVSAAQEKTLTALIDTLVPADEHGPAGTEVGVGIYIAKVISDSDETRGLYGSNLDAVERLAAKRFGGTGFAALDQGQRSELVRSIEAGEAEGFSPDAATFFAVFHHHMLEGMFGDPEYGGNIDFAGWKLVGFRGVKLIQTFEDQSVDGAPDRPLKSRRDAIAEVQR
jgi:hypothetical protein